MQRRKTSILDLNPGLANNKSFLVILLSLPN